MLARFHRHHRLAGVALALSLALPNAVIVRAEDAGAPAAIGFDEIDHVYTSADVPPPGSFDADLALVDHPQRPGPPKKSFLQGAMRTLSAGSTQLGNVVGIVGASGQLGQTLNIANGALALAPVANAMGLAGAGRIDALVQTYILPRVSPTGAQALADFLAAQNEAKTRYPHAVSPAPATPSTPSPELAAYGHGSLRSYTVAANGWVRIDDRDRQIHVLIEPDRGTIYAVDDANRTVHASAYDAGGGSAAAATRGGAPVVTAVVEPLGTMALAATSATGYHTRATMHVAADAHGCTASVISSDRVEYFAPFRIASSAANATPLVPAGSHDSCAPSGGVAQSGTAVPADRLMLYQANTIARTADGSTDRYTLVIERGHVHALTDATAAFSVPSGYRTI